MANVSKAQPQAQKIGENVQVELTDDEIIIKIKRDHRGQFTGKTIRVASTLGNKQVTQEGIIVGLNAYVYPSDNER